ncbi:MAG: M67 family peptidase [Myxococcales bacterium]|nr:M67 family peptidase [Myxococcales bacterium]
MCHHVQAGYPHEVVGLLAGSASTRRVTRVLALHNERADSPANRYQVSGLVVLRGETTLEAEGLDILGYYHSHPDHPSAYSDYDREHALPNRSYVIVSIGSGQIATTQSWRLRDDRSAMDEELLLLEAPCP